MGSLYRTLSLRYLGQRWTRAALVVASIALGVATLVATRALNQSMIRAAQEARAPLAGLADLHVTNGEAWVRRDLLDRLRAIPEIWAVEPVIVERLLLPDLPNGRSALLLGVELRERLDQLGKQATGSEGGLANSWGVKVAVTNPLALLWGNQPVLVGKELAAELKGKVRVMAADAPRDLTQLGTLDGEGAAADLSRNLLLMDVTDAARLLGRPVDLVTRIDLFLEPGADREQVRRSVELALAGQAHVQTPESQGQSFQEVMAGIELGFSLSGMGALIVGLFLVYNALSVSVAERRHDIGILRSLGATRSQIAGLFAGEAAILGLSGAGLGVPVGWGLANLALGPVQRSLSEVLIALDASRVVVSPSTILGSAVAGVATALLAALVPALQAASDQPADAVRRVPTGSGLPMRLFLAGILVTAGGVALFLGRHALPARIGIFGSVSLGMIGFFLAIPLAAALVARLIRPLIRRFAGIGFRLAADNLARSPGRTGLVIAALAAGIALTLQTAGVTRSNEDPILEWIDETLTADVFLSCGSPVTAGNQSVSLREDVADRIQAIPGVDHVLPIRFRRPNYRNTIVFLIAFDAQAYYDYNRDRTRLPHLHLFPLLRQPNTVLISENFAALHDVHTGDTLTLSGPRGPVELRVVGQIVDYSWNRGTMVLDRTTYQEQFQDQLVDVFDVYFQAGEDPDAVRQRVQTWGADQAMFVSTRAEVYNYIRAVIRRVYGLAYLQEILVGLVAALGVVMALLISILQRQRELGLLRAVGATRAQVLRSVLAEATLMGVIGSVIGVLIGIPLEWCIVRIVILEESGFLFPVLIPWQETAVIAALAMLLATGAGFWPALQTVRLRIPEAIAYE